MAIIIIITILRYRSRPLVAHATPDTRLARDWPELTLANQLIGKARARWRGVSCAHSPVGIKGYVPPLERGPPGRLREVLVRAACSPDQSVDC